MRVHIKVVTAAVILSFLVYMAYSITLKYLENETLQNRISTIPSFRLERLTGGTFTEEDLAEGSIILNYFNTTCEFCRAKLKALKSRMEEFEGVQLVFVSSEEKIAIKEFSGEREFQERPNVIFLQDPNLEFSKTFGVVAIPVTFIYNKDRQLIKEFKGAVKIESMLEALHENPRLNKRQDEKPVLK